jgi:hypothetical protein
MPKRAESQNSEKSSNACDGGEEIVTILLPPERIDNAPYPSIQLKFRRRAIKWPLLNRLFRKNSKKACKEFAHPINPGAIHSREKQKVLTR